MAPHEGFSRRVQSGQERSLAELVQHPQVAADPGWKVDVSEQGDPPPVVVQRVRVVAVDDGRIHVEPDRIARKRAQGRTVEPLGVLMVTRTWDRGPLTVNVSSSELRQ